MSPELPATSAGAAPSSPRPYADNLRHVLNELEGAYLVGYGDGSARVQEAEPIVPLEGAAEKAAEMLTAHPDTRQRITRVLEAADGFDSMYGMELLATVRWVATHSDAKLDDLSEVTRRVQSWNRRKRDLFTERHIRIAWEHLGDEGWLAA